MPETATERKDLVRLLRFVLAGPCQRQGGADEGSTCTLVQGTRQARFATGALAMALRRGLLAEKDGVVTCLPAARSFVKRAMSDTSDEAWLGQHHGVAATSVTTGSARIRLRVNLDESPLSTVARLKDRNGGLFLPPDALAAGNRLHADFTRSQLQPRITQTYAPRVDGGRADGQADLADTAIAARTRLNRAIVAMGPELSGVALDVCCFSKGLERVEQERGWPVRSAKLMLRTALLALHRHYAPPARPQARKKAHWGEDGFRPEMADFASSQTLPGG